MVAKPVCSEASAPVERGRARMCSSSAPCLSNASLSLMSTTRRMHGRSGGVMVSQIASARACAIGVAARKRLRAGGLKVAGHGLWRASQTWADSKRTPARVQQQCTRIMFQVLLFSIHAARMHTRDPKILMRFAARNSC